MKKIKNIIVVLGMIVILTSFLFILSGCKISAETNSNGVSVEVDEDTKSNFENILKWINKRINRVFTFSK